MRGKRPVLSGMQRFTLIWLGQMLSLFGTATTRFALLVWAYQQTGQATTTALLGFFSYLLYILLSPVAGAVVDRLDRRLVLIGADLGAAIMTLILLTLYRNGNMQIWHLYLAEMLTGAFEAFQLPAYSASITMLVPKTQYGRVSGMRSLSYSASQVIAPLLAGLLLGIIGLAGVMVLDVLTFAFAFVPLLVIRIPNPPGSETRIRESWRENLLFGLRFIFQRRGLLGLLLVFIGINLASALTYFGVLAPMVLARTGGSELALGAVQGALGIGGVIGGLLMSITGGPKKKIHGVLLGGAVAFLIGDFLMAVGREPVVWAAGALFGTILVPVIVGCDRAIWQAKTPPEMQGRVFSAQDMVRTITMPIGYLITGPLADRLFEPAMAAHGPLAGAFGWLVGTGPGAGMGLMFLVTCIVGTVICLAGYLLPAVRNVESELPDHDVVPAEELAPAA